MRVQVFSSGFGSSVFLKRLMSYLVEQYDVEIVRERPDIYLSSIWRGRPPKGCKIVHRVDGVYFDKTDPKRLSLNKGIEDAINRSSGVIYQSQYSKKMAYGILSIKQKRHTIIHNGFPSAAYDQIEPISQPCKNVFVACAKWRPLKRPFSTVKGFLEASVPDSHLYMIGECKHRLASSNVTYVGRIKPHMTLSYYKISKGLLHISRLDACPNAVIESLTAGVPVVCNNVGGTPEIVKDSGIILDIDPLLEYKPFKMKNPDSVNPTMVASGIHQLMSRDWNIRRSDLDISHCAKKYYDFFCEVLKQ